MRHAVGLILMRPGELGATRRVYLVERRPELAFFGGYWAFVGGTVEEQDDDPRVPMPIVIDEPPTGDSADAIAKLLQPAPPVVPRLVAAAARELFEETGILLARGAGDGSRGGGGGNNSGSRGDGEQAPELDAAALAALRDRLVAHSARFADLLADAGLAIDAERFTPVCRMITPPFSPVRFDTLFFLVDLGSDQEPSVLTSELTRGEFIDPGLALAEWREGERLIVPPGVILLRMLTAAEGAGNADHADQEGEGHATARARFLSAARHLSGEYARGKIHQVCFTPGVQLASLLTNTHPPADHTNAYLVGEEEVYLVDPGSDRPAEQAKLFEAIDEVIAQGRRLVAILLTHEHPDHIGAVAAVVARHALPVWAHAETARALDERAARGGRIAGDNQITVARALTDGDTIPLGRSPDGRIDWTLTALHTPGHARGHLAFRESRYGAILAGDLVSTLSTIAISPPEGHMATYLASLARLRALPRATIYPSHGPPRRDSHAVIDALLAHRARREEKLVAALGDEFRALDAILERAYDDAAPAALGLARRSLLAGLEKLIEEGRVEERGGRYRRRGAAC